MNRRGYTMAEMLVTMAVISVMAAMSMYGFDRMTRGAKQAAAVREVYLLVQEARSEARARNQPVRLDVTSTTVDGNPMNELRWGRLPCGDAWGRTCPSTACVTATTCGTSCVCERRSEPVRVPTQVTMSNVAGLCFLGSNGQPRGASCDVTQAAVTTLRFDLANATDPWLIVLDNLTGGARLVDCGRVPKDGSCP